ncbi:S-methyl-5-thioribose-1-phosphate isomerase [Bacteriovoracaceae bacterium]|nr:S-methyl-5-thioribose-1-phosphate isomerase [Bacteriovoracaceae bacterium]
MNRNEIISFSNGKLSLIDQRFLPHSKSTFVCGNIEDCHYAIKAMVTRGAPLIGFTAIYSLVVFAYNQESYDFEKFVQAANYLNTARPTAVNLAFELDESLKYLSQLNNPSITEVRDKLSQFGLNKMDQLEKDNTFCAQQIEKDLKAHVKGREKYNILTHCNTGRLACGALGTALGSIEYLAKNNLINNVFVSETRPYLQGSRLTAFELAENNIPHKIIVEGSVNYLLRSRQIDAIFVGADRITLNGDTANKVGTSNLGLMSSYYGVPLYVVAPVSSFDNKMYSGDEIEIELRPKEEISQIKGVQISPYESETFNPSFDITDNKFIHAIVNEKGLFHQPFYPKLNKILNNV